MRVVIGLILMIIGLLAGVRLTFWTQSEMGELWGLWTGLLATPLFVVSAILFGAGLKLYRSSDLPRGEEPIAVSRVFAWICGALILGAVGFGAIFYWPAREVTDQEMSYSFRVGERVWVLPPTWLGDRGVGKGDVVRLVDPLEPSREVLRRVVAGPGDFVEYEMGELGLRPRVNRSVMNEGPVERQGFAGTWNIHTETLFGTPPRVLVEQGLLEEALPGEGPSRVSYLTHNLNETLRWRTGQGILEDNEGSGEPRRYRVMVPEGHYYVMADDRDVALDSRWWGPISESSITGVVRLHRAVPDLWREEWQVLGNVQ